MTNVRNLSAHFPHWIVLKSLDKINFYRKRDLIKQYKKLYSSVYTALLAKDKLTPTW